MVNINMKEIIYLFVLNVAIKFRLWNSYCTTKVALYKVKYRDTEVAACLFFDELMTIFQVLTIYIQVLDRHLWAFQHASMSAMTQILYG